MNFIRQLFLLACILGFNENLHCQFQDAGLWMNLNVEKKLTENLSLQLNQFVRLDENCSEIGTWGSEVGFNRLITKKSKFAVMYRLMGRRRNDLSYSFRHRFFADISRQSQWRGMTFQARVRWQMQYRDVNSSLNGWNYAEKYIRTLFFASKRITYHWSAFAMAELFSPVLIAGKTSFAPDRTMRYVGLNFRHNRHSEIILYYLINRPVYGINPRTDCITGIRWDLTL